MPRKRPRGLLGVARAVDKFWARDEAGTVDGGRRFFGKPAAATGKNGRENFDAAWGDVCQLRDGEDRNTYVWPDLAARDYRQQRIAAGGDSGPSGRQRRVLLEDLAIHTRGEKKTAWFSKFVLRR